MKVRIAAVLLSALLLSPLALADQPVVIGVNVQTENRFDLVRSANLGWSRVFVDWADIQPVDRFTYDWSYADATVNLARAQSQQILFPLGGPPEWAGGGPNRNIPPSDINLWIAYVSAVAARYSGQVAAYEVWNEPDREAAWNRHVDEYPRYVDYFVTASRAVKANDPAALMVGPTLSGGANDRTRKIFLQFEETWYEDGNASDRLDVVSVHQNACCDDTHSGDAANLLRSNKLSPLSTYNPRNAGKPIWITEFGWKSGAIGENSQRIRIQNFLTYMTGGGDGRLRPWNITQAFIYKLLSCDESRGIYLCSEFPKQVVTAYLWNLPFPATHQPGMPLLGPFEEE